MEIALFTDIMIRLTLGFGIGFTIGMTGIGAGILVVPSLLYIVGLPAVSAVGTGLVYSVLVKSYGAYEHFKLRTIRKRTAFYIVVGGAPAVLVTSFAITHLAKTAGDSFDSALKIVIGVVMLAIWTLMFRNVIKNYRKGASTNHYVSPKRFPRQRKFYGIAVGVCVGILLGSTSISGAALITLLITVFQLSPNNTVGTSVFIGVVMSSVGAFVYLLRGNTDVLVAVTMFIGSIPGVYLGSRTAVKLPHRILSATMFSVVTISVIVMFVGLRR